MTRTTSTHTFALLEVTPAAFEEVRGKLEDAGYTHAFHRIDDRAAVDMHGIALTSRETVREFPARSRRELWQLVRDEIGFGVTVVPDEDGLLGGSCTELLEEHAKRLAELRSILQEPQGDDWNERLRRAAYAVVAGTG